MAKNMYLITYCFTGFKEIEIEAETEDEAKSLAETIANELDCGCLTDIDTERLEILKVNTEDKKTI